MPLAKLKELPKDRDLGVFSIDLSDVAGEGAVFRFRSPKAADLFPDSALTKDLRIGYAEYPEALIYQIYILGRCYLPAQDDDGENPYRAFADLGRANAAVFYRLLTEFMNASPLDILDQKVAEAKNASAE